MTGSSGRSSIARAHRVDPAELADDLDTIGRQARERGAHEGEVARRPRHPERYPELIRRQPRRPPCAEPFERARSNERALERETQVARLRGRQNGPLGARQDSSDTQVTGTNPSSMGPLSPAP